MKKTNEINPNILIPNHLKENILAETSFSINRQYMIPVINNSGQYPNIKFHYMKNSVPLVLTKSVAQLV